MLDDLDDAHLAALPGILQGVEDRRHGALLETFLTESGRVALVSGGTEPCGIALAYERNVTGLPIVRQVRAAEIDALVVQRDHRRQGHGRALVEGVVAWAQTRGAARIELGVYEFNDDARAFWQSMGFDTLSRRLHKAIDRSE